MEKDNNGTQEAIDTTTAVEAEEPRTMETLMERMKAPREKIDPPSFVDDFKFMDGSKPGGSVGAENEDADAQADTAEEPLTEEDRRSAEYLNYDDEHRTTAIWIIRTIDRGMGMLCGLLSGQDSERYHKYSTNEAIGDDYLDVTAALVKKYQARLSLEFVFVTILLAAYVPNVTMAYKIGKMRRNATRANAAGPAGTNQSDGEQ